MFKRIGITRGLLAASACLLMLSTAACGADDSKAATDPPPSGPALTKSALNIGTMRGQSGVADQGRKSATGHRCTV
jgi:hypothetical protein